MVNSVNKVYTNRDKSLILRVGKLDALYTTAFFGQVNANAMYSMDNLSFPSTLH